MSVAYYVVCCIIMLFTSSAAEETQNDFRNQIKEYAGYLFQFNKVVKGLLCYI